MIKKPLFGTRERCDFDVSGSARHRAQKSRVRLKSRPVRRPASHRGHLVTCSVTVKRVSIFGGGDDDLDERAT